MMDPIHGEVTDEVIEEIGHSDRHGDLSTPEDDDQAEPNPELLVEDDYGAES